MSEKSCDKIDLNVVSSLCKGESDTAVLNKNCIPLPLTIAVDIEQNRVENDSSENIVNRNESSLRTINSVGCNQISAIDEIESTSTVFSSDSSIIDDTCSDSFESNNRNVISIGKTGQSIGLRVPNILNVGSIHNCNDIEVGGLKVYNGPVTINHIITNHPDINHQIAKPKKSRIKPGLIVTYFTVVFLLISIIIILVNNITNLTPIPQILRQTTAEQSDSISSSENSLLENSSSSDTNKSKQVVEVYWNCKNEKFISTYVTTIILILLANFMIYLFMTRCKKTRMLDDGDNSNSETIVSDEATIRVVSRAQWQAKPPKEILTRLVLPSTRVIIAHTDTNRCSTQEMCSLQIRHLQLKHMDERGWDDIGYNFLVGGDGCIYVGRGWDQQGAHSRGFNTKSICIAFIGRFNITEPPECQLIAAQKLIEEGVKLKKLSSDYRLYGHRQLRPFESPGQVLFGIIQKWNHWSPEIMAP